MNPSPNETGLKLPAPVSEQAPSGSNHETSVQQPEQFQAAAEQAPMRSQQAPAALTSLPLPSPVIPAATTPQTDVSKTSNSTSASLSDDDDLIEKEWVEKAKQIVERTRDNPYQQSEELTGVRADYMKKRYNKSIKLSQ